MNDTFEVRDDLIRLRDEQLRKLVDLARERKTAEAILAKAYSYERAAAAVGPAVVSSKYGKHKSTIFAILDYLDEVGRPATADEIIKALVDGGFRGGDADNVRTKVLQCIGAFTGGLGRNTKQIKKVQNLVGRGEWEAARFKAVRQMA